MQSAIQHHMRTTFTTLVRLQVASLPRVFANWTTHNYAPDIVIAGASAWDLRNGVPPERYKSALSSLRHAWRMQMDAWVCIRYATACLRSVIRCPRLRMTWVLLAAVAAASVMVASRQAHAL